MGHMPAIPQSTRDSIVLRLILHARENWPQLKTVQASYRGSFAYITAILPGGEQIPLFRLRYGGSAHSFGFAIYSAARDRYEDAVLLTGYPTGTPQEALDTAATVHLTAIGHEPPQNLRPHPLSHGHERSKAVRTRRTARTRTMPCPDHTPPPQRHQEPRPAAHPHSAYGAKGPIVHPRRQDHEVAHEILSQ
jgi:hypothetical protein